MLGFSENTAAAQRSYKMQIQSSLGNPEITVGCDAVSENDFLIDIRKM